MSSDYITRLRGELVNAAARRPVVGPRPRLRLAPALAAIVLALLVVGVLARPGIEREAATPVEQTQAIMRERLDALELGQVSVEVRDGVVVAVAPEEVRATVEALRVPGRLRVYDWERNLLTPEPVSREEAQSRDGLAVHGEEGWFVLRDRPAMGSDQVQRARVVHDGVRVDLDESGRTAFERLTREVARRGDGSVDGAHHIAIVLDDRLLVTPFVTEGQAGEDGLLLAQGNVRVLAAILDSGPLPQPVGVLPG